MDVYEIRLINLRMLAAKAGSNSIKHIGSQIAREAEQAFDKPRGWLDQLHPPAGAPPAGQGDGNHPGLEPDEQELLNGYRQLSDEQRDIVLAIIRQLAGKS